MSDLESTGVAPPLSRLAVPIALACALASVSLLAPGGASAGSGGASASRAAFQPPPKRLFKVFRAVYDGRVLALTVFLPAAGTVMAAVPVACARRTRRCRKRDSIAGHIGSKGRIVLRKALSPRLRSGRRLTVLLRLFRPTGAVSRAKSTVIVNVTGE